MRGMVATTLLTSPRFGRECIGDQQLRDRGADDPAISKSSLNQENPFMPKKNPATNMTSRIGDEAVRAKTGKTWAQWIAILDKAGAKKMSHNEIATFLRDKQKLPGWWCQMVAVGYEQSRGLRKVHETAAGFQTSISKTVGASLSTLYRAWKDDKVRDTWLPKAPMNVRKATASKSIRIAWNGDISNLDVRFYSKGKARSQVVIDQVRLKSAADVQRMKKFWSEKLQKLQRLLEA
jgi:hypothetical protein